MKKLIIFLVLVFGIILNGICQSYYIKHDHICRGSSYQWTIYNATPNDTIIYRSRTMINGTTNWDYDTIIGNSITLVPNDSINRFEVISINNNPDLCKERLQINLHGYQGDDITVSNNTITLPNVVYAKIINSTTQQVYDNYAGSTTISNLPPGTYNIILIDDATYACPVTILITIP